MNKQHQKWAVWGAIAAVLLAAIGALGGPSKSADPLATDRAEHQQQTVENTASSGYVPPPPTTELTRQDVSDDDKERSTDETAASSSDEDHEQTLSNDDHYTNVDGHSVHSPAYTSDDQPPPGATAQCRDGTYSFSENRRGTCSHHGGVARWLY